MRKRIVLLLLTVLVVTTVADDVSKPHRRQLVGGPAKGTTPAQDASVTTPSDAPTPNQPGGSSPSATPSPPLTPSNPSSTPGDTTTVSTPSSSSPSSTPTSSQTSQTPQTTDSPLPVETTSASIISNPDGVLSTVIVTGPAPTNPSDTIAPSQQPQNNNNNNGNNGVGLGTIIGLSVAGGVTALAIIGFIIWKLTRKRFADFDGEHDEAIKWPELSNAHAASTTEDLSRAPSNIPSDPYAVPPLPQFNPNQPYRDDPHAAAAAGYYDPYRGPIPQVFQDDMGENIPMSTYPPSLRTQSPGPNVIGRGSPAPGRVGTPLATGVRTISPAPGAALGGPQFVPGAQPEMARYHSPGPNPYG